MKSENYQFSISAYEHMLEIIELQDQLKFCDIPNFYIEKFSEIFYEDQAFASYLRTLDLKEYASHIEENKMSDLLYFYGLQKTCKEHSSIDLSLYQISTNYSLMNAQYLQRYHQMWVDSLSE